MSPQGSRRPKNFTVSEANATLPLVRAIITDLVALSKDVIDRRQRLSLLSRGRIRSAKDQDLYQEELRRSTRSWKKTAASCRNTLRNSARLAWSRKVPRKGWSTSLPWSTAGRPICAGSWASLRSSIGMSWMPVSGAGSR